MTDDTLNLFSAGTCHAAKPRRVHRTFFLAGALWLVAAPWVLPGTAHAETAPPRLQVEAAGTGLAALPTGFKQPRQMFVSVGTESLFQGTWTRGFRENFNGQIEAAVGYFFNDRAFVRLGLGVSVDQLPKASQDVGDVRTTELAAAPGVGAAFRLHPKVTLAPWAGVGFARVWRSLAFSGYRSTIDVQASAPFVFDFVDHVSFFLAPSYKQLLVNHETFSDSERRASLGGRIGISIGALAHW